MNTWEWLDSGKILHEKNYSESYCGSIADFVKPAESYGCVGIRAKTHQNLTKINED